MQVPGVHDMCCIYNKSKMLTLGLIIILPRWRHKLLVDYHVSYRYLHTFMAVSELSGAHIDMHVAVISD